MIISHTTCHVLDQFQHLTFIGHVSHFLSSHATKTYFPQNRPDDMTFTRQKRRFETVGMIAADTYVNDQTIENTKCATHPLPFSFFSSFSYCNSIPFVIVRQRSSTCLILSLSIP